MYFIYSIIIFEIFLYVIIKILNRNFKWILIKKNENFIFNNTKFTNFINTSYDKELGWDKKPNSTGFDLAVSSKKKIKYKIDKNGSRDLFFKFNTSKISSFGDSYVFCRNVNDRSTWQTFLSKKIKSNVLNYGVGNYGLDQIYLKFKKKSHKKNKIILIGFVPETICRIQSYWKNFLEFGNYYGFKPVFFFKKKFLLKKNPIKENTLFKNLPNIASYCSKFDRFYNEKFIRHIFKFPYSITFLKFPIYYSKIIFFLIVSKILKFFKYKYHENFYDLALSCVIKNNIKNSHSLYKDYKSLKILKHLLRKIKYFSKKNKQKLVFIIFPQLDDLKLNSRINYQKFLISLKKNYNIIDLTESFLNINYEKIYTNDKYGGHLSKKGNMIASNLIYKYLNKSKLL